MTFAPHIPTLATRSSRPRSFEIRWSAVRPTGASAVTFVVAVQTLDATRALLESWIEDEDGTRDLVVRQPTPCRVVSDGELLHVDIDGPERAAPALLAVSLIEREGQPDLLYARTTLLARTNLQPGTYDPPRARMLPEESGAASA